jgi:hypothetical protein
MKQKIILSIAILSLLSLAVFVAASTEESYINIEEGWNLVYGFVPGSLEGQSLDFSHIKAIYAYIPEDNEYLRIYPNPENDKIDLVGDKYLESSVMWVYSDVSMRTEYWFEEPLPISETRLSPGYNLVRVTPDMFYEKNGQDVFSWDAVRGDCNIEKVYAWNPEAQDWMPISPTQESFDFNDFYMMGMAVKVTEGCYLGESSGDIDSPPQIPN